jgi:hypothetical protein
VRFSLVPDRSGASPPPHAAAAVACCVGLLAAAFYWHQGLTLSHYDAKAHLVVARRVLDSLRPGWVQIGAVWPPLPHLVNLLPVQVDWLYQTGLSAVVLSIGSFVVAASALWWLVASATGSRAAAWAAFAVLAAQPDILYLQSTPMTEPLLLALCLLGAACTWRWLDAGAVGHPWHAGASLALACLTRFEAWPISAAIAACAAVSMKLKGLSWITATARAAVLAAYPIAAIGAFMALGRATVGHWLVTDGFYQIDPSTYHRLLTGVRYVGAAIVSLNGLGTVTIGIAALLVLVRAIMRDRQRAPMLVALALAACAVLPLYAFWNGHPFRVRYMVPLAMALAATIGFGVGLLPRRRLLVAVGIAVLSVIETPPFTLRSPMILEAQWDRNRSLGRQHVTECLVKQYDGRLILASMGSLAHYMQETSRAGFPLRTFIHEGIGDLWAASREAPAREAGWVLIEEQAKGRDVLARRRDSSPAFLAGFTRVCEGGGVALYRRTPETAPLRAN